VVGPLSFDRKEVPYLIIRTFQLVFSAGTVFFSQNKSANSTFSHGFLAKRTGSYSIYNVSPFFGN
jgi:hypothetical protein